MKNELYHHGILGQKWGKKNGPPYPLDASDHSASEKKAGWKKSLTSYQRNKVASIISNSSYKEDVSDKVFDVTKADKKKLQEAYDVLEQNANEQREITKQKNELFKELENDRGLRNYYEAVSEIASYGEWGRLKKNFNDCTLDDMASGAWMGIFEDGQQSSINAYSMYTNNKGLNKEVRDLTKKSYESNKNAREASYKIVQNALDEVGGENLLAYKSNSNYPASKAMVDRMMNTERFDNWETISSGGWYLNDADHANEFTSKDKENIKKVEKWSSNLNNNKDRNTWYLLNEAVENLGMSSTKANEMTKADWDKVNKEISRLRKSGRGWD